MIHQGRTPYFKNFLQGGLQATGLPKKSEDTVVEHLEGVLKVAHKICQKTLYKVNLILLFNLQEYREEFHSAIEALTQQ